MPSRPPIAVPASRSIFRRRAAGGLPPGPPPGSRIQIQPLPPPPGATSAPPRGACRRSSAAARRVRRPAASAAPAQPASLPPPNDETIIEPPAQKIPNPTAVFSGLDKITGRIISFDVAINETVRFGALEVTPRACYTRPPTEAPTTDGFIEVDEVTLQGELKRIFTGWMFAASPGLNAVEHPIYDVWLTDCKGAPQPAVAEAPAARRRQRRRAQRTSSSRSARRNSDVAAAATAAAPLHAVAAAAARPAR